MARELGTVDDYLSQNSPRARFNESMLGNWKKDKKKIRVWLHTKQKPVVFWRHQFPRLVVREDKQTGDMKRDVWAGFYNCLETDSVCDQQNRRTELGERVVRPQVCPMCKFVEWVHGEVFSGRIHWCKNLFKLESDKETTVIHAGGVYGAFEQRGITDAQKAEMRTYKITPMHAWRENMRAKQNYLFTVVDNDAPEEGVRLALEGRGLGQGLGEVLVDARESLGIEGGDPFLHPFCFQWEYRENEKAFGDKYKVRRLETIPCTSEIFQLITGTPPDISNLIAPMNVKELRASMEHNCLLENVPWDSFFDGAKAFEKEPPAAKTNGVRPTVTAPLPPMPPSPMASPVPAMSPTDEMALCDACGKVMRLCDSQCPHCGEQYELIPAEQPPPPAPALKKRSDAIQAPAVVQTPVMPESRMGFDDSDEIPF